jgi:hypothetical protein
MSGCSALLRCSFRPTARRKARRCLLGSETCADKGGSKAAGLCLSPFPTNSTEMESTKMTRKRKRDSEPSSATAQPPRVNESGAVLAVLAAPQDEIRANIDLEVTDAQNKPHGTQSSTKKLSRTKKKNTQGPGPLAPKPKIIKLKPARPYPTVPTSSSATVPKSRRAEGRNEICVTRRTELGSYLRQCRDVLTRDGYVHIQT